MRYLSRCQYLLQQGLFVADLLYFTGEDPGTYTKVYPNELTPAPPEGYDYDLINGETILKRVRIVDGRIVLPDGISYRAFVLQQYPAVSLELLRKLHDLVSKGMVLIGAPPVKTLGLHNLADAEKEFNRLTGDLWGSINGTSVTQNRLGAGLVFWGVPVQEVLRTRNVQPDFEVTSRSGDAPITYIHRKTADADVYFVANQRRRSEELVCTFRVNGRQPELWDPVSGAATPVPIYQLVEGRVRMPVQLGPSGSFFIVFRTPAKSRRINSVVKEGKEVLATKPLPATERKLYKNVANNFTFSLWVKPEMDVMLSARIIFGGGTAWTDYYTVYPPSGAMLYGNGHETVGLTVGRNGVALWTNASGTPVLTLAAPTAIAGWSHVAVVYKEGVPFVYVAGKLVQQGQRSENTVHPGLGQTYLGEGASYYNGDMTAPQLFAEPLSEDRIRQLAETMPEIRLYEQPAAEVAANGKAGLLFWEDGRYALQNDAGNSTAIAVSGVGKPLVLSGSWQVHFPTDSGAPQQIILPQLMSLHKHAEEGVKYFSGTASYQKNFQLPLYRADEKKRLFLDLGRVEVMAQIILNGKDLGVIWQRPYRVDITEAAKAGANQLEVKVTNLWPNRLIGDAQKPDVYAYQPFNPAAGPFASLSGGGILQLPDWYQQGKPKPDDDRVTFTTWKHYREDSPLLESGLIGPVVIRTAVFTFV